MPVYQLSDALSFPPLEHAEPDGLLAIGGDLSLDRLLLAYRSGLFPWYNEGEPIMWWSPDPRLVLRPSEFRVSRSLKKTFRKGHFCFSVDRDFESVIRACATTLRPGQEEGTWIGEDMIEAYCALHRAGVAHSLEVWQSERLVGGMYGVSIGACFYGESMFSLVNDASKCGFIRLVHLLREEGVGLIDCQVQTEHLLRFGARSITRAAFADELSHLSSTPVSGDAWLTRGILERIDI